MTCNLEKNKGVSVKSLPLGGEGASLQFVTLAGSEPGQLAEHAELLQKAEKNGLRWIGPEVYGSADLDISPVPGAGMTAFLGTNGRILLLWHANLRGGGGKCPGD